jgi:hypothetical protein
MQQRRSPQEKKRLSYTRDRRNDYGENDKSSRRNIARNKRVRHRADRHHQRQLLAAAVGPVDEDTQALPDRLTLPRRAQRGDRWRKQPDVQLGLHIARALKRRAGQGSSADTERERIRKVLRNTAIDGRELRRAWRVASPAGPGSVGPLPYQKCATTVMVAESCYPASPPDDTA